MKISTNKLKHTFKKILKKIKIPVVFLIVLFAIVFSLFRALTPWAAKYKSEFESQASIRLGQPVTIQSLETSWYWFKPVLKLNDVRLHDNQNNILTLNKLLVGIDLWDSLWNWQIRPGVLYLGDVDLVLHQKQDHWEIDGLKYDKQSMQVNSGSYLTILGWLLSQESVIVKHLSAKAYLVDGAVIALKEFNFKAVNSYGNYKIYGNAELQQKNPTAISLVAKIHINPEEISKLEGKIYISLQNFIPTQWSKFLPNLPYTMKKGVCNLDSWLDMKNGKLASLQTVVDFKNISLLDTVRAKTHNIKSLQANILWKNTRFGWKILADKIKLNLDGLIWPENKLSIVYFDEEQKYSLYVQKLMLSSLFATNIAWPNEMREILKARPKGELYDTQLHFKESKLNYILTRFSNISWYPIKKIPAVENISGVLYWEPTEGRLVLDSEKTTLIPKKYPPITFEVFNSDIYWKELNNGLRIDLDRFILSNDNLVLSASGVLDNFKKPDSSIRLEGEFSAKNASQFLEYIPSGHLKPKFEEWLKKDVRKINSACGRVLINGKLDDFPFDSKAGEFLVTSHVSGVDIAINNNWPLNQDINADLEFKKRDFTANVDSANLQGLAVNKLNLAVNNIGSGRESLLIHGEVDAPGSDIKKYIYHTPLNTRLARWKKLEIADEFWVDLNLDIPLYPENNHVVALGEMVFSENPVAFNFDNTKVLIDDVTGNLKFNEYGLTTGQLKGMLDGSPLSLQARSLISPKERTEISVFGEMSIDYLRKVTSMPIFSLFGGSFNISALWTIYPSVNNSDNLLVESNLQEVSIDLPPPFNKSAGAIALLKAEIEFANKDNLLAQINFNNILDAKLFFRSKKENFSFTKGEILIGNGSAGLPNQVGLHISGIFDSFDTSKWATTLSKIPKKDSSSSSINFLYSADFKINDFILSGKSYKDLVFKVQKNTKNEWSFNFNQVNFSGNLLYDISTNSVSGVMDKLFVNLPNDKSNKLSFKPRDIPNLDISVKDFKVNELSLGSLEVKSNSTATDFNLNSLIIKSPDFIINGEGKWRSVAGKDKTGVKTNIEIKDLAKSLERFNISPVVSSRHGSVNFDGQWNSAAYDFSLKNLVGDMYVILRNGRISNFDKSVEEKLGLGKLLSILSLQTIPRRLKLDFSDLAQDGYSFDVFKGVFDLNSGVMSTTDSYIDGPVAYAKMSGSFDLTKHLYDINLKITPYITASLPVVATIAGGPIAGFATWVASSIINKGMQNISGYTYKISGPWKDPVVQQVKIYKKSHPDKKSS